MTTRKRIGKSFPHMHNCALLHNAVPYSGSSEYAVALNGKVSLICSQKQATMSRCKPTSVSVLIVRDCTTFIPIIHLKCHYNKICDVFNTEQYSNILHQEIILKSAASTTVWKLLCPNVTMPQLDPRHKVAVCVMGKGKLVCMTLMKYCYGMIQVWTGTVFCEVMKVSRARKALATVPDYWSSQSADYILKKKNLANINSMSHLRQNSA